MAALPVEPTRHDDVASGSVDATLRTLTETVATLREQLASGRLSVSDDTLQAAERQIDATWRAALGSSAATAGVAEDVEHALDAGRRLDDVIDARPLRSARRCRDALAELRSATTVDGLLSLAVRAICRIGFDRSIVSRVAEGHWVIERTHVERDPVWARQIHAAGRAQPLPITPRLHEIELVRHGRPIVVRDVPNDPRVHRPVAEASESRSYTAVPVTVGGRTVGFLHADCHFQERTLDEHDRDLLWAFATGFGYALERVTLLDRLAAVQHQLSGLAHAPSPFDDRDDELTRVGPNVQVRGGVDTAVLEMSPHGRPGAGLAAPDAADLTPREREVLELIAHGASNQEIARGLTIAESTVKTHVKHVLRKLGAANRAEATAIAVSAAAAGRR